MLTIGKSQVSDAGLIHLYELNALQHVDLRESKVSKSGIDKLKARHPNLSVVSEGKDKRI